jgi:catechol 2,3-dioxygenase-like lactoylglutathione lyase family enzyme
LIPEPAKGDPFDYPVDIQREKAFDLPDPDKFWVKGLDAIYEELKGKGVKFATPPHIGAQTKAGTFHTAFVEDPDGVLIQLDEMVPA